jgi:hypothetical protein
MFVAMMGKMGESKPRTELLQRWKNSATFSV